MPGIVPALQAGNGLISHHAATSSPLPSLGASGVHKNGTGPQNGLHRSQQAQASQANGRPHELEGRPASTSAAGAASVKASQDQPDAVASRHHHRQAQQPQQHHDDAQQHHDTNGQQQDFGQEHQPRAKPAEGLHQQPLQKQQLQAEQSTQQGKGADQHGAQETSAEAECKQRQQAEAAEARLRAQKAAAAARARQKQAELQALRQKFNAAQAQVAQKQV